MSVENVHRFMEETRKNAVLQAKMKEAGQNSGKAGFKEMFEIMIRPFAEEMGLPFTLEEYLEFLKPQTSKETLSLEEMEGIVGGAGNVEVNAGGDVTIIDQSHNTFNGPDMSFLNYLVDKFY